MIGLVIYAYAIETIQILRGLDPRFSSVATDLDRALGGIFFLSAQAILVSFLVLSWRFLRQPTATNPLVLAVRYASVAALLAFAVGDVMSLSGGAEIGAKGNWLPLHALGFHGLQAIPLVALLLRGSSPQPENQRLLVHLAGAAWLGACLAIGLQSLDGRSVLEASPLNVAGLAMLVAWGLLTLRCLSLYKESPAAASKHHGKRSGC